MNRIILIGNGFDLAHGMKTSYSNFLFNYWNKTIEDIKKSKLNQKFENDFFVISKSPAGFVKGNNYQDLEKSVEENRSQIKFKNRFLKTITDKSYIDNWVDVENEYYQLLKQCFNVNNKFTNHYKIEDLNSDFNSVKELLRQYLIKIETEFDRNLDSHISRIKNIIGHKIYSPFDLRDFSEESLNEKAEIEYNLIKKDIDGIKKNLVGIEELNERSRKIIGQINIDKPFQELKKILQKKTATNHFDLIPEQTLFLNFNYTFTDKFYADPYKYDQFNKEKYTASNIVHIHGTIDEYDNNPIIFGFGDELDDDYQEIEKSNENKYLENIKSINYLETDNYKKLLEFINSANFQVFIFGHSCGTSDRTMLNTIFEHDNCSSIKPFYHQRSENNDNYSDIVRNISRNFYDKAKMRDRVVNKSYCEPFQ